MSGVAIDISEQGLAEALLKIEGIADAPTGELMEGIGRLVQEQTRHRIVALKTSPAGAGWKPNRAGTSTLFRSGTLADSIDYLASNDSVQVGSGLVYARIHQEGGKIEPKSAKTLAFMAGGQLVFAKSVTMPARTYIGLSSDNRQEIVEAAEDWLSRLVQ